MEYIDQLKQLANENINLLNSSIRDFNNHSENFEINYENNIKKINYNTIFI